MRVRKQMAFWAIVLFTVNAMVSISNDDVLTGAGFLGLVVLVSAFFIQS